MSAAVAAVVRERGAAPAVEPVELPSVSPGRVRVRMRATGVCHSDLSLANGTLAQQFPAVLGHEGAGTVVECGDGVALRPGDHVVLNWTPPCRACWFCTHGEPYLCERAAAHAAEPYARLGDGTAVFAGLGVAAFATETVVPQEACVRVPEDVPLDVAALLGCAVLTGVGAVLHAARVQPGESVVVLGLGGVGLAAVQGARLAGARPIIGVDPSEEKWALARSCGAHETLPPSDDLAKRVRALTEGRGADHAVECVGRGATIRTAWSCTRRGGAVTVVGMGGRDDTVAFNALEVPFFARTLRGCMYGSSDPERDIPVLLDHVRAGRIDVESLVTARTDLSGVAGAFDALARGEGARTLIVFDS